MNRIFPFLCLICLSLTAFAQNSALRFDGQEEYLTLAHDDGYNIGNTFTIEAWILASQWRQAQWQGSIAGKDNQGPDRGFSFRCGNNGTLSFVMSVGNVWQEAFTSPIMNVNQWHHVAAVVDGGNILLYVDGQQAATHSFVGSPSHSTDMDIHIGASPGFGGRHFEGVMDEIRIWDVARTQQELLDNSTVDLTGSETGLVAYFPMNEGSGQIAGDLSATQNDASLNLMDNSNWVTGYTLPDYDVAVKEILGIDVVNMIDRPVRLSTILQNNGTLPITNIDIAVKIDGNLYHTETITEVIQPGNTLTYGFGLPIDLVGLNDPELTVEASQGDDTNLLNNEQSLVVKTGTSTNVIVKDKALHRNGELLHSVKMTLPTDLHKYEQMMLNIDLTCPAGGCGPWDVLADLVAITNTGSYELARYITPYGIACGGWVVDITDFKSVLGGEVEFQTNIFVYTAQGWLLDMSIDLIDNDPQDRYSQLTRLWELGYQVYGDPGISYDLPEIPVTVDNSTTDNHVRMTITGHGQGNTNNAAEFFNVNHELQIGGSDFHTHNLWKADCAQNPCDNQAGSWIFSRAGWCPGQAVDPYVINTTGGLSAGSSQNLDYELQTYTNLLNTGYNNSSHTEPYYKIYSYFVENAPSPYRSFTNLELAAASGFETNASLDSVEVEINNTGFEDISSFEVLVYYNKALVATETVNEAIPAGGSLTHTVALSNPAAVDAGLTNKLFVEVSEIADENPGDDIIETTFETVTSIDRDALEFAFQVFPNPSATGTFLAQYDPYWDRSLMRIYTVSGQLVQEVELKLGETELKLEQVGTYVYTLVHSKGAETHSGLLIRR
ncbi:MAG: LamG-like jellyroll fold domain-containing protein [Bacteroidota bacterium]